MIDEFNLGQIGEENIALRGRHLVKITVKNDKGEELKLKDVFDKLYEYMSDNKEKIDNTIGLVGSFATGPFSEFQKTFVMGYLYCKYISKLEEIEKCKYEIEFTEREITKEEARKFVAEALEKSGKSAQDFSKKLRDGEIDIDDIAFPRM